MFETKCQKVGERIDEFKTASLDEIKSLHALEMQFRNACEQDPEQAEEAKQAFCQSAQGLNDEFYDYCKNRGCPCKGGL